MQNNKAVSQAEWLAARKELLKAEKDFTRLRDELSRKRRDLPWVRVDKSYAFDGPNGRETLPQLFDGCSQLVVYHFMYGPNSQSPCKSCSFWADSFDRNVVHLRHRDVTMIAVSRAPLQKLEEFKQRMGWTFKWVSSGDSDFNFDYQASFTPEDVAKGQAYYNFTMRENSMAELPGISVFYKDPNGSVFHTYSCYSRGIDMMNAAYQYLDLVPKGRDESNYSHRMTWVRYRDSYEH